MATAFNFNYKSSEMFQNIQPAGYSVYGQNGLKGKRGNNGSSVYFINQTEISDTLKLVLIGRMNTTMKLDGSGQQVRKYNNGDLIICKISRGSYNAVYRITQEGDDGEYDIEPIGRISTTTVSDNPFDYVIDASFYGMSKATSTCRIPVTRSFDMSNPSVDFRYKNARGVVMDGADVSVGYDKALRTLFGLTFKPQITLMSENVATNYEFLVRISLKNRKSMLGDNLMPIKNKFTNNTSTSALNNTEPYTNTDNADLVEFDKIIEIPLTKYYDNNGTVTRYGKKYNDMFLSDMACDKLHPSGNNITASFFDPYRGLGYSSVLYTLDSNYPLSVFMFEYAGSPVEKYIGIGLEANDASTNRSVIYDNIIERIYDRPYAQNTVVYDGIQIDKTGVCDFIQRTKTKAEKQSLPCIVNYMSGESAYFSGMVTGSRFTSDSFNSTIESPTTIGSFADGTYDMYVAAQRSLNQNVISNEYSESGTTYINKRVEQVKNYVCKKIYDFIFDSNNTFELVAIDKRTGRTKYKQLKNTQLSKDGL